MPDESKNTTLSPRLRPMKVLALGLGRTGTTSLNSALREYGYNPYDFPDRLMGGHNPVWDRAMMAKFYGEGTRITKEELNQLTGDYDCILDTPCCFFASEFIAAYPDAKIILNSRDFDSWFNSMHKTIFAVIGWPSWQVLRWLDPRGCGPWLRHVELTWRVFCDGDYDDREKCRRRYEEHYDSIRRIVPSERLLEYRIEEGWQPLVGFLGLKHREGSIARSYGEEDFMRTHVSGWRGSVTRSVAHVVVCMIGVGVAVRFASLLRR